MPTQTPNYHPDGRCTDAVSGAELGKFSTANECYALYNPAAQVKSPSEPSGINLSDKKMTVDLSTPPQQERLQNGSRMGTGYLGMGGAGYAYYGGPGGAAGTPAGGGASGTGYSPSGSNTGSVSNNAPTQDVPGGGMYGGTDGIGGTPVQGGSTATAGGYGPPMLSDLWRQSNAGNVAGAYGAAGQAAGVNPQVGEMPNELYGKYNELMNDPTANPFYKFTRDQMMKGLERQLAASRMSKSGNALEARAGIDRQALQQTLPTLAGAYGGGAGEEAQNFQAGQEANLATSGATLEAALQGGQAQNQIGNALTSAQMAELQAAQADRYGTGWAALNRGGW